MPVAVLDATTFTVSSLSVTLVYATTMTKAVSNLGEASKLRHGLARAEVA